AGVSPRSIWDGLFEAAGEALMRRPGIVALHAVTSINAIHFAYQASGEDETRRLLMLQAAAFMTLFREILNARGEGPAIDAFEARPPAADGDALEDIFAEVSRDRMAAAQKTLAWLSAGGDAAAFMDAARRLVFLKGNDSH